jgi:hypothetical protein
MHVLKLAGLSPLGLVPLVSAFFGVACIALSLLLLQRPNPEGHVENLVGAILLGLSPQLWFWSTAGLETTLFAALLTACVALHVAHDAGRLPAWVVGAAFGLSALARPEGLLLFGLTLAFDAALMWRDRTRTYQDLAAVAGGFAVPFVPVFLCKWSYFGYPLPNTYDAKTGADWFQIRGGWAYLVTSLRPLLPTASLPLLLTLLTFRKSTRGRFYILTILLSMFAIIIFEGGDYIANARFVTPVLPLLFVLAAIGITEVTPPPAAGRQHTVHVFCGLGRGILGDGQELAQHRLAGLIGRAGLCGRRGVFFADAGLRHARRHGCPHRP